MSNHTTIISTIKSKFNYLAFNFVFSTSIVRWHSFQSNERPDYFFKKCYGSRSPSNIDGMPLAAMSCGQIQVKKKIDFSLWHYLNKLSFFFRLYEN